MTQAIVFYVDEKANLDFFKNSSPTDWDVHTFSDGFSALNALAELTPSLLITDVMMEGMHGLELMFAVKKILLEINLVCISGISKEEVCQKFGDLGSTPFFKKPLPANFIESVKHLALPIKPLSINMSSIMLDYLKDYEQKAVDFLQMAGDMPIPPHRQAVFSEYRQLMGLSKEDDEKLWATWRAQVKKTTSQV